MKVKLPYKTDQIYDNHPMSLTQQGNFQREIVTVLDDFIVNFSSRCANLAAKLRGLAAQLCGDLLNVIGNKALMADAGLGRDSDHTFRNKLRLAQEFAVERAVVQTAIHKILRHFRVAQFWLRLTGNFHQVQPISC